MEHEARDIARQLARNAHSACRHYLPNGRRDGSYWLVGDIHNSPGRSLYLRLVDSADGRGRAGKWTDAQTGEHGDLLDIIAARCNHVNLSDTLAEARHFLSLPEPADWGSGPQIATRPGSPAAARRLWAAAKPCAGDYASAYLAARGLGDVTQNKSLRFHPRCYYRLSQDDAPDTRTAWPALIAAITDIDGGITGVHRTWLDAASHRKAPVACPRKAMGQLLGNAVRFGKAGKVMVAGEGLETILSFRAVASTLPALAGLSAGHLSAIDFPSCLQRLYIAQDNDPAGIAAFARLRERADPLGIEIIGLEPCLDDFNSDLVSYGPEALIASLEKQLMSEDTPQFLRR